MAFRPNKSFRSIIDDLGLSTGLQICLDAGDAASYPGSGQKWLDRANSYDFFLGIDGTVAADDPTFNGTAGGLTENEFWSFDNLKFFRYDSANEPWMNTLHKDNAKFTMAAWVRFENTANRSTIFGTLGTIATDIGIYVYKHAIAQGNLLSFSVGNGAGSAAGLNSSTAFVSNQWTFVGFSLDEAVGAGGLVMQVDATQDLLSSTYTAPSAADATWPMEIGAGGNGFGTVNANDLFGAFMMWNRALSAQELMDLYQYPRVAFSGHDNFSYSQKMTGY